MGEKKRKLREKKEREEKERKEELRRQLIESQKKSILLISGFVREFYEFEANKETMTFIPVSVTTYIHIMYHDTYYHCDRSYKFYGDYTLNKDVMNDATHSMLDIIDRSQLNIEQ